MQSKAQRAAQNALSATHQVCYSREHLLRLALAISDAKAFADTERGRASEPPTTLRLRALRLVRHRRRAQPKASLQQHHGGR